jgi:quercetin 2,3-dioxygenase
MHATTPRPLAPSTRPVSRVVRGFATSDGAGVRLTRVLGTPALRNLDPFLMLDEFRSDDPSDYLAGFPEHPHRGFETITYMLAGRFRHKDNKGHEGLLGEGGAQWMTAGRGIVHSEMPEQHEGLVWGFQLWLNLPAKDKMREPSYRDLGPGDIPEVTLDGGVRVRVLAGEIGGATGPIGGRATEPLLLDVAIPEGGSARVPVPAGHVGFVFPFEGELLAGDAGAERTVTRGTLGVLGEPEGADVVRLVAKGGRTRVFLVAGKPLGEPIAQHGPFVMNTRAELEQAIRDYAAGLF